MKEEETNLRLFELARKERTDAFKSLSVSHDRLLVTLSSALIGFSLIFAKTNGAKMCNALLYSSWTFLGISVVSAVILFWFSYFYTVDKMKHEAQYYLQNKKFNEKCSYERPLYIFSAILDISFLLGFAFFLIWAGINL